MSYQNNVVDVEKGTQSLSSANVEIAEKTEYEPGTVQEEKGVFKRMIDSFKPPSDAELGMDTSKMSKHELAHFMLARSEPKLRGYHIKIITLAGCIGTGLFVQTGNSLHNGGPAALVIAMVIISYLVVVTMSGLSEIGVRYPSKGSFYEYIHKFVDSSLAFAMSWIYTMGWLIVMPLEACVAAMLIRFWKSDGTAAATVNPVAWTTLFFACIIFVTILGTRAYGEAEMYAGLLKLCLVVGFLIFSLVVNNGGGPNHEYIGGKYWRDPGSFTKYGFKGVVVVIVNSSFAFGGSEVAGIAAAETPNPRKALNSIARQVVWRVILFFIVTCMVVGFMVPYDSNLIGTSDSGSGSPFIAAIQIAGVRGLPSVFNAGLIICVFSVGCAAVFIASRSMVAIGLNGHGPTWLSYVDRHGRPIYALCICYVIGLLCFSAATDAYVQVFDWTYAFAALAFLYVWWAINLCHIRVRLAMRKQGVPTSELVYKAPLGLFGSVTGFIIATAVLGLQFWTSLFPLGKSPDPEIFFKADLSVPVLLIMFVGHKLFYRTRYVRLSEMDIHSNTRELDHELIEREAIEDRARARRNWFYGFYYYLC